MAFQSEANWVACGVCKQLNKFFKMWNNPRIEDKQPMAMSHDEETGKAPKTGKMAVRICVNCELEKRKEEWKTWSEEKRQTVGADYTQLTRVQKDMKKVNKGTTWNNTARALTQATKEVREERKLAIASGSADVMSRKQADKAGLARALQLATALLTTIQQDTPIWQAFEDAGGRFKKSFETWEKLSEKYDEFDLDQDPEKLRQLEEMEEKFLKDQSYTCMSECGEMQREYLKALDFSDQITDRLRLYNVCRAKMGNGCTCGLAFPAKMWTQTPGTWKFFCKVDCCNLVEATLTMEDENHVRQHTV